MPTPTQWYTPLGNVPQVQTPERDGFSRLRGGNFGKLLAQQQGLRNSIAKKQLEMMTEELRQQRNAARVGRKNKSHMPTMQDKIAGEQLQRMRDERRNREFLIGEASKGYRPRLGAQGGAYARMLGQRAMFTGGEGGAAGFAKQDPVGIDPTAINRDQPYYYGAGQGPGAEKYLAPVRGGNRGLAEWARGGRQNTGRGARTYTDADLLGSNEKGTLPGTVPETGSYKLHENEVVLSADQVDPPLLAALKADKLKKMHTGQMDGKGTGPGVPTAKSMVKDEFLGGTLGSYQTGTVESSSAIAGRYDELAQQRRLDELMRLYMEDLRSKQRPDLGVDALSTIPRAPGPDIGGMPFETPPPGMDTPRGAPGVSRGEALAARPGMGMEPSPGPRGSRTGVGSWRVEPNFPWLGEGAVPGALGPGGGAGALGAGDVPGALGGAPEPRQVGRGRTAQAAYEARQIAEEAARLEDLNVKNLAKKAAGLGIADDIIKGASNARGRKALAFAVASVVVLGAGAGLSMLGEDEDAPPEGDAPEGSARTIPALEYPEGAVSTEEIASMLSEQRSLSTTDDLMQRYGHDPLVPRGLQMEKDLPPGLLEGLSELTPEQQTRLHGLDPARFDLPPDVKKTSETIAPPSPPLEEAMRQPTPSGIEEALARVRGGDYGSPDDPLTITGDPMAPLQNTVAGQDPFTGLDPTLSAEDQIFNPTSKKWREAEDAKVAAIRNRDKANRLENYLAQNAGNMDPKQFAQMSSQAKQLQGSADTHQARVDKRRLTEDTLLQAAEEAFTKYTAEVEKARVTAKGLGERYDKRDQQAEMRAVRNKLRDMYEFYSRDENDLTDEAMSVMAGMEQVRLEEKYGKTVPREEAMLAVRAEMGEFDSDADYNAELDALRRELYGE